MKRLLAGCLALTLTAAVALAQEKAEQKEAPKTGTTETVDKAKEGCAEPMGCCGEKKGAKAKKSDKGTKSKAKPQAKAPAQPEAK